MPGTLGGAMEGTMGDVTTALGRLHFERTGAPSEIGPIVLLHGMGMSSTSYDDVREKLAAETEVISIDFPGHGQSEPATEDLTCEQARTLAAVVSFIQGDSGLDQGALSRAVAAVPVGTKGGEGNVRDPTQYAHYDAALFSRLEQRIAASCGSDRIPFHFI